MVSEKLYSRWLIHNPGAILGTLMSEAMPTVKKAIATPDTPHAATKRPRHSPAHDGTKPMIDEMMALFAKLSVRFTEEDDEERQWMLEHTHNPAVIEVMQDMTVIMLHVLDAIGQLGPVNGITISKQFRIAKGSVSKITRRLIAKKTDRERVAAQQQKRGAVSHHAPGPGTV